jgi:hypothetical protein
MNLWLMCSCEWPGIAEFADKPIGAGFGAVPGAANGPGHGRTVPNAQCHCQPNSLPQLAYAVLLLCTDEDLQSRSVHGTAGAQPASCCALPTDLAVQLESVRRIESQCVQHPSIPCLLGKRRVPCRVPTSSGLSLFG